MHARCIYVYVCEVQATFKLECGFRRPARDLCARSACGRAGGPRPRAGNALFMLQTLFLIQSAFPTYFLLIILLLVHSWLVLNISIDHKQ